MICLNIPLFMVGAFLLLTLVVGIYFSSKKTTFREYAVGNKQFATATLVATVLATFFEGGGLVRNVECIYDLGLWFIGVLLLVPFGIWTISRLSLRMGPFMQHLSIAETMGSIYGKYPRIITVLIGICRSIIVITSQIIIMSQAISICLTLANPYIIPILSTLLLIMYSTFGGVRAVTFTDVVQFITFSIIIPLLCWFTFVKVGKPIATIAPILQSYTKFQFSSLFHFNTHLVGIVLLLLGDLPSNIVDPALMQRVYMASSPIQARKVFSYATTFCVIIQVFIILIGLFTFVGAPGLPKASVWAHVITNIPPLFKGVVAISLLAMAMSTADSCLNACSVMVSQDIVKNLENKKEISDRCQIKIARWTTLVVGLSAMLLTFKCKDLLRLVYWSLNCKVPILAAPFILAVFGFRGTSRTALIGMVTGALTILAWNKWVESSTGIDGSFICMLTNGLAMLLAHYLFKQPEGRGWVGPDHEFLQMQQARARKKAARKESIKNGLLSFKDTLANLRPSRAALTCVGLYVVISNLLTYFIASITDHGGWLIAQLLVGVCFVGYRTFIAEKVKSIPSWVVGLCWIVGLAFSLPINVLWHWWHGTNLFLTLGLSLAHLAVTLLVLPLYLGVSFLMVTLCMTVYLSSIYYIQPLVLIWSSSGIALLLLLCLGLGLLIFGFFVYLKSKNNRYFDQITYLKDRAQLNTSRQLKESLYNSAMVSTAGIQSQGNSSTLAQVVGKIEESISFLDSHMPLYKQDFQSIINKLYDWVAYFNRSAKAKKHALLQPTSITLDKLMCKVELALSQEMADPPRLLVEKISAPDGGLCADIICDIHQVVYLLVQAVLRVGKLEGSVRPLVKVQLQQTTLQFKQADAIDNSYPSFMLFQAIALVVSDAVTAAQALAKVQGIYDDRADATDAQVDQVSPPSIDLQEETLSTIVAAHYGHVAYPIDGNQKAILLVLPNDVTAIRDKMTAKLPIDCLTLGAPVTPKEQADSMMALMRFHDYVCKSSLKEDPIDVATISGLLLLLRKHFGFKRHLSGQLFYVRAVGIAELVVEWVFHSPKVIYAALLYELVRHTCLPLSYIQAHYNLGVYAFVLNVVGIDKRQALDHPSLLYVQNRLKEAIKEDHVQLSVLFIKLAERLYDLRHAAGYTHLPEVAHMAQETLTIDVQIAHTHLGPEIGDALKQAAKQALELCENKEKEYKKKEQDG